MTLLLVEDLEDLRAVLQRTLSANGFEVLAAADAEEALQLAAQPRIKVDLLFVDWQLPGMSGRALAQELIRLHPDLRVLLTSGQIQVDQHDLQWLQGRGEYLAKPYDLMVMLAALRRLKHPS
jgi:DNA-binding response OmpR family regulator